MTRDELELGQTLRGRRRSRRVLDLLEAWTMVGVMASALSAHRQAALVERLRPAMRHRLRLVSSSSDTVVPAIDAFAAGHGTVVLIGWQIEDEPALLLSFKALNRAVPHLRTVYPDGFVLLNEPLTDALLIEVDPDDPAGPYIDRLSWDSEP